MALDIVYGFQGKDHVTAAQLGRLLAGTVGGGRYVLNTQNKLKAEMQTANKLRIGTGDLVMDGRYMTNEAYVELTVNSGISGQKRNDIAGVRYEKASGTGIETSDFVVLEGTSTSGTPADPEYEEGNILEESTTAFMPLWRIPIDGLNVGKPVQLFEEIKSSKGIWDSVSQTLSGEVGWIPVSYFVRSGVCTVAFSTQAAFTIAATDVAEVGQLPEGIRPATDVRSRMSIYWLPDVLDLMVTKEGKILVSAPVAAVNFDVHWCFGTLTFAVA